MRLSLFAAAVLLACSLAAHADTFQIAVQSGSDSLTFNVPSAPTNPEQTGSGGFELNNLTFNYNGKTSLGAAAFYPFSTSFPGIEVEFGSTNQNFIAIEGIQVFTGMTTAPIFTLGTFTSTDTEGLAGSTATVNITDLTPITPPPPMAATPEPSSVALLGTGMLGMISFVRTRCA